jgi:hypothetical protein
MLQMLVPTATVDVEVIHKNFQEVASQFLEYF